MLESAFFKFAFGAELLQPTSPSQVDLVVSVIPGAASTNSRRGGGEAETWRGEFGASHLCGRKWIRASTVAPRSTTSRIVTLDMSSASVPFSDLLVSSF